MAFENLEYVWANFGYNLGVVRPALTRVAPRHFKQLVKISCQDDSLPEIQQCLMQCRGLSYLSKLLRYKLLPIIGECRLKQLTS